MEKARDAKLIKSLQKERGQLPDHLLAGVDRHNVRFAVRRSDVIETGRKRSKVRGKGKTKKWLPQAVQRLCFGRPYAPPSVRKRVKGKSSVKSMIRVRVKRRSPCASSVRATADWFESAHNHCQQLRNCLAFHYLVLQEEHLRGLPQAEHAALLVQFDETEQQLLVDGDRAIFSFMMLHVTLIWTMLDGTPYKVECPVPPTVIADTSAKNILTAILKCMPLDLKHLKAKVAALSLILVSDSARACKKAGRHFKACAKLSHHQGLIDGVMVVHKPCLMHQLGIVVGSSLRTMDLIGNMFCACCLMQRGSTKRSLKAACRTYFDKSLQVVLRISGGRQ